jgi:L-ascorbate metabolism protein UlaG (beta-lactamase superfamily)
MDRHRAFKAVNCALLLAAVGLATAGMSAEEDVELRVTFIGNMAVHATDGRTVLVTDFPYESGAFGYMKWRPEAVPPVGGGLALITHRHRDHFAPELLSGYELTVAGPAEVLRLAGGRATLPLTPPVRFRGIEIEPRPTPHASLEHFSYVVTWHGLRLYFTGDTEDPRDLLAARDLDVAFVSPWLLGSVRKQGARIDARRVVVYHHQDGEDVVSYQDRWVPAQGKGFRLSARRAATD